MYYRAFRVGMDTVHYEASALVEYANEVLCKAGLESAHAHNVAHTLVEGALLAHDTHGLALLPGYVKQLEQGAMTREGLPQAISDRPAALLWDGRRLPGPSLVHAGIDALPHARANWVPPRL